MTAARPAADTIDRLVAAYNARDARAFADLFAEDAVAYEYPGEAAQVGREAVYRHYADVFARYPGLRTEVLHRVVTGGYVVDHERVRRGPDAEPFDVVAVYTLADGRIRRLELVRAR